MLLRESATRLQLQARATSPKLKIGAKVVPWTLSHLVWDARGAGNDPLEPADGLLETPSSAIVYGSSGELG